MKSYIDLNIIINYLNKIDNEILTEEKSLKNTIYFLETNFNDEVKDGILEYLESNNIKTDKDLLNFANNSKLNL